MEYVHCGMLSSVHDIAIIPKNLEQLCLPAWDLYIRLYHRWEKSLWDPAISRWEIGNNDWGGGRSSHFHQWCSFWQITHALLKEGEDRGGGGGDEKEEKEEEEVEAEGEGERYGEEEEEEEEWCLWKQP